MRLNELKMSVLLLAMFSTTACTTTYDCANSDVTDLLVEQVADKANRPEWAELIRQRTNVGGVTTQSADTKLGHFQCSTKLTYVDDERTLESMDINYEVKPVEGGEMPFELAWETVPTFLGDADPIANMSGKIIYPWVQKEKLEKGRIFAAKEKEIEALSRNEAIEYAKANPPIPLTEEELLQEAKTADLRDGMTGNPALVESRWADTSFGDLNGDGHGELAAVRANTERDLQRGESATVTSYSLWVFEQSPVKYGEKFSVHAHSLGKIGESVNDEGPSYSRLAIANGKVAISTPDGETHEVGINKVNPFPPFDNEMYLRAVNERKEKLRAELAAE